MSHIIKKTGLLFSLLVIISFTSKGQRNLLLNGSFEDINTCTEYSAECGVEGWFYLRDVKAQMLNNDTIGSVFGANTFGIFTNWQGYTGFTPVIGTLLPCQLQKGKQYTFKGLVAASLNSKLDLKLGVCLGERFYVPNRPFSKTLYPDSIENVKALPESDFFQFEYIFEATGKEKYLTLGTYVHEDRTGAIKKFIGTQTISLKLDNFELLSSDPGKLYAIGLKIEKQKYMPMISGIRKWTIPYLERGSWPLLFHQMTAVVSPASKSRRQNPKPTR